MTSAEPLDPQAAAVSHEPQPRDASTALTRRRVFAGAGTVGALAVVAAVLPSTKPAPGADARVASGAEGQAGADGYRLTDHVLRYYQTARV